MRRPLTALSRALCPLVVFAICLGCATGASAQWAWKDDSGHVVFSDVPPPPSVKPADIIHRPSPVLPAEPAPDDADRPAASPASAAGATAGTAPAAAPTPAAPAPKPANVADQEQAFRTRQKDRADADRKQADEAAKTARDAENCERAKGYQRMLEDSGRVVRTNPDGSREVLDDSQRAVELDRAQKSIQQSCK